MPSTSCCRRTVGLDRHDPAIVLFEVERHFPQLVHVARRNYQITTCFGQPARKAHTKSPGGAGHDRRFAREVKLREQARMHGQ
jgi:hypothetical protein